MILLAVPFLLYVVGAVIACIGLHDDATRELTEEEAAHEKEIEENHTVFELFWMEQGLRILVIFLNYLHYLNKRNKQ